MNVDYQTLVVENSFPKKKLIHQRIKSNSLETKLQKYDTNISKYIYNGKNHKNLSKKNQSNDNKNSSIINITDSLDDTFILPNLNNDDKEEEFNSDEYISSTNLDVETNTYIDENEQTSEKKNMKSNVYNKGKILSPSISKKFDNVNFYESKHKNINNEEKDVKINNYNIKFIENFNATNKNIKTKCNKENKPSIYKKVDLNKFNNIVHHTINSSNQNNKKKIKNINKKNQNKKNKNGIIEKSNTEDSSPKEKEPLTVIMNKKTDIPKNEIYSRFSRKVLKTGKSSYTTVNTNTNNTNNNSNKENFDMNKRKHLNRNIKIASLNIVNNNSKNKAIKKSISKKINRINSLKKLESLHSPKGPINNNNQSINNISNNFVFSPLKIFNVNINERNTTPTEIIRKYPFVDFINNSKNVNYKISLCNKNIPNILTSDRNTYMNNQNIIFFNLKNINSPKKIESNKALIKKKYSRTKKDNNNSFAINKNPLTKKIDHKKTISSFSPKSQRIFFNKKINLNLPFIDTHVYSTKNKIFPKKESTSNKTNMNATTNQTNNLINTIDNSRTTNSSNYNKNYIYSSNVNKNIKSPLQNSEIILVKNNSKAKYKHDHSLSSFGNKNNGSSFYQIYKSNKNLFKKDIIVFSPSNFNNYTNKYLMKKKINYSNNQSYNSNLNNSINKSNTVMINNSCMCDETKKINYKKHFIDLNTNTNKCRKLKKFIPIDRNSPSNNNNKRLIKEYANNNVMIDNCNTFNDSNSIFNKEYLVVSDEYNKRKK